MKSIKILAISILQTLLFTLSGYLFLRLSLTHAYENAGAIGIIGGADGPTAIFTAFKFDISVFFQYSYVSMFILFLIANLSALIKNKIISVILAAICFLLAVAGIYFLLSINGQWLWIVMILIAAALMTGGYILSRRICNEINNI